MEAVENRSTKAKLTTFFKNKNNIFITISFVLAIVAIILFLLTPSIIIELNDAGKAQVEKIPAMKDYTFSIGGLALIFGIGNYDTWKVTEAGKDAALISEKINMNIFLVIALALIVISIIALLVLTILNKNNVFNKIAFAGLLVGAIMMLLSPIWFYACNEIKSSLYKVNGKYAPYEFVNAHSQAGSVVASLCAIASSVFAGLTLKFKD